MAKAIDIKRQYDSAQEFKPHRPPRIEAHTSDGQEQVSRPGNCTKCDGSLCPYRLSQENECDVYGKITMSRAAELMNKIGYKYHVDKMRRRNRSTIHTPPHLRRRRWIHTSATCRISGARLRKRTRTLRTTLRISTKNRQDRQS